MKIQAFLGLKSWRLAVTDILKERRAFVFSAKRSKKT
jgi:hypothetical protein